MGTRIGIARNPTPRSQTKKSLRKFDARPTYILSWALQSTWMRWGDHGDDDQRVWLRMHHLIHVLQRGRVICASHIAVFETIVKDLSAGPAASEKESISREPNELTRQRQPQIRQNPKENLSTRIILWWAIMGLQLHRQRQPQISRNPKHINEYGYECIISSMYCSEEEWYARATFLYLRPFWAGGWK